MDGERAFRLVEPPAEALVCDIGDAPLFVKEADPRCFAAGRDPHLFQKLVEEGAEIMVAVRDLQESAGPVELPLYPLPLGYVRKGYGEITPGGG